MTSDYPSRRDLLAASGATFSTATVVSSVSGRDSGTLDSGRDSGGVKASSSTENPDIETLREKWFLEFDGEDVAFPPSYRRFDLPRYSSADVEVLYDGEAFMDRWHETATELIDAAENGGSDTPIEIYHQTLRLDDDPLLADGDSPTSFDMIQAADEAGVDLYFLMSGDVQRGPGNAETAAELDIETVVTDSRVASVGSNHQKVSIFRSPEVQGATVGSSDLYASRWGRRPYANEQTESGLRHWGHDVTVWLEGPVVRDLQQIHIDRWNDDSRDHPEAFNPHGHRPPEIETSLVEPGDEGSLEVQILQTFGRSRNEGGYTWAENDKGEFTGWAGYINAIQQAQKYIYIEDQFFQPEGRPGWHRSGGEQREGSLFAQLGDALERGVDVIAVTRPSDRPISNPYSALDRQREDGVNYLDSIAADADGDFETATIYNGVRSVSIHSKLMLVDDEVSFIGSMNTGRRSLSNDGEIQLAIIDEKNEFTQEMRTELWRVYMGESPASDDIPDGLEPTATGPDVFIDAIRDEIGLLRPFERNPDVEFNYPPEVINFAGDPYTGPPATGGLPQIAGAEPRDILGDGLFRDITGSSELTIFDIQALFNVLDSEELQAHAESFDFGGVETPRDEVTIADLQALFDDLAADITSKDVPVFGGIVLSDDEVASTAVTLTTEGGRRQFALREFIPR